MIIIEENESTEEITVTLTAGSAAALHGVLETLMERDLDLLFERDLKANTHEYWEPPIEARVLHEALGETRTVIRTLEVLNAVPKLLAEMQAKQQKKIDDKTKAELTSLYPIHSHSIH